MELFKEIILEGLQSEKIKLSFPHVNIDIEKIVHDKSYQMVSEIKQILENSKIINDFYCVEEIIRVFERMGDKIEYRHDFG